MSQNIVLISVDSLRADFCPWESSCDFETPNIAEAAADGLRFTRGISPGHATPVSMPQIFTGHSLPLIADGETIATTTEIHETIPETLSRRGYETIGFTPNPFTSRKFGFDSGFDYFEDFLGRDETLLSRARSYALDNWGNNPDNESNKLSGAIRLVLNLSGQGDSTVKWRDYYDELCEAVSSASEPFFLWVFLLEPHWPYFPSRENRENVSLRDLATNFKRSRVTDANVTGQDRERLLRLYKNTIKDVDDFVGKLMADLREYDPAYIFHSDHGEAFGERGQWGHPPNLYEENIHVPLGVWNSGASGVVSSPMSLRQIPEIIQFLADGSPSKISSLTSPYARAHNSQEISIAGQEWLHCPSGGQRAPSTIESLADTLLNQEEARVREELEMRDSANQLDHDRL